MGTYQESLEAAHTKYMDDLHKKVGATRVKFTPECLRYTRMAEVCAKQHLFAEAREHLARATKLQKIEQEAFDKKNETYLSGKNAAHLKKQKGEMDLFLEKQT